MRQRPSALRCSLLVNPPRERPGPSPQAPPQAGEQALPHGAGELGDRVKADQDLAAAGRPDLFDALRSAVSVSMQITLIYRKQIEVSAQPRDCPDRS